MLNRAHAGEYLCNHSLPGRGVSALFAFQRSHGSTGQPYTSERSHCSSSGPDCRSNYALKWGNPGSRRGYEANAYSGGYTLGQRCYMNAPFGRQRYKGWRRILLKESIGSVLDQDPIMSTCKRYQACATFDIGLAPIKPYTIAPSWPATCSSSLPTSTPIKQPDICMMALPAIRLVRWGCLGPGVTLRSIGGPWPLDSLPTL